MFISFTTSVAIRERAFWLKNCHIYGENHFHPRGSETNRDQKESDEDTVILGETNSLNTIPIPLSHHEL